MKIFLDDESIDMDAKSESSDDDVYHEFEGEPEEENSVPRNGKSNSSSDDDEMECSD